MPNYQGGKIYTIRCRTDETLIYVGSTIQPLTKRWGDHKNQTKYQNMLIYKTINNNWNDWYIELYEEYPCENKEQLCKREGEVIRLIGTLNSRIEGRTRQEYYQDNKKELLQIKKEYYENHKEYITQYKKLYHINNKEHIHQIKKENYEDNKDNILTKLRERITCECGCILSRGNTTRHKKSLKHIQLLENI